MAQPEGDRLEYALSLLDDLTGSDDTQVQWLKNTYGFSTKQSKMVIYLNGIHPHTASMEQINVAVNGPDTNTQQRVVSVMVCRINQAHPGMIENAWGVGYRLTEKLQIGNDLGGERRMSGEPWTWQMDEDLIRMFENGSDIPSVAYEMNRSERAVIDRRAYLKRKLST